MALKHKTYTYRFNYAGASPAKAAFTACVWFKWATGEGANERTVCGINDDGSASKYVGLGFSDERKMFVKTSGPTRQYITDSQFATSTAGVWHFLAWTYDGAGNWRNYYGNESTAVAIMQVSGSDTVSDSGWGDYWPANTGGFNFNGMLGSGQPGFSVGDELAYCRVWTAQLSVSELEAERLKKSAVKTASLWSEWDFSGYPTTHLNDSSGNSRTFTYETGDATGWESSTDPSGMSEPSGASALTAQLNYFARLRNG